MSSAGSFFYGRDICACYSREQVLKNVSFAVERGSLCGLLGPNGAGKSTLFKCCMNFINKISGEISVQGVKTLGRPPAELARLIAYVPQEHRHAFAFSVRELVSMGRNPRMGAALRLSTADHAMVDSALEKMGITHLAGRPVNSLSGGQRQLTLIARALAQEAPLMLLDEPTASLDFSNQIIVWRALRALAATGITILVCCHDPNHIMWFCDQVLVMSQGEIIMQSTPGEISKSCLLADVYGEKLLCGAMNGRPVIYPAL